MAGLTKQIISGIFALCVFFMLIYIPSIAGWLTNCRKKGFKQTVLAFLFALGAVVHCLIILLITSNNGDLSIGLSILHFVGLITCFATYNFASTSLNQVEPPNE